ncbi:hypothetical protein [Salarchaeum sp. JOR-1]|uniref:hypothetical protein n=1 Tax=Salarchaeum sp. JOR-1 TaxID=2599399 RepID=UPI00119882AD|nr:hypothetical protein [Salarchaeum sp. JOR-1]QDX39594.1 hypothetical protein FQU85_01320 [Salarchaeum sp. JOR-1]
MAFPSSLATALSSRPKQLLGAGFGLLGTSHFAFWTQSSTALSDALAAGDYAAALAPLSEYAAGHPAYLLAIVTGIALVAWAQ